MRKLLLSTCALALVACSSNSLSDPDHVKTWATTASAVGVFANVQEPLAVADGQHTFTDAACPLVTDDGTTLTIHGSCTDSMATMWVGGVTVVRAAGGDRTMTFDHYGKSGADGAKVTGTFTLHAMSATQHTFDASFTVDGGTTTTVTYSGTVQGTYGVATVWSGSGTVSRSGLSAPNGTVMATTTDERIDDATCSGQPSSGTTRITADGHTATITYNGATSCDMAHDAEWTLDGADQGLITGIDCSAVPGVPAPGGVALGALGVVALVLARRRR